MKKSILVLALVVALISGFATVALADQSHVNGPTPSDVVTPSHGGTVTLDLDANGKIVPIHSGFTVNTDACASCHSTHQAKDQGKMLLQWTSPSETCMACHDGTVTVAYDVEHGKIADTGGLTLGGLFATNVGGVSASQHDVDSLVKMNNIPGGKTGAAGADGWGTWDGSDFECTSCHEPHGSGGNARLLHPNPNGVMQPVLKAQITPTAGAYNFSALTTSNTAGVVTTGIDPATNSTTNVTAAFLTGKKLPNLDATLKFYDVDGVTDISKKVKVEPISDGAAAKDVKVTWNDTAAAPAKIFVDYTPVLRVDMTFQNNSKYTSAESILYGQGMQEFCGACHTDYYGSRGNSRAYVKTNQHHNGGIGRAGQGYPELGNSVAGSTGSCLTCHYAHGVDQSRWDATKNNAGTALWVNKTETAGSSALKRLPNMGTCEVCHAWEPKAYNATNNMVLKVTPDGSRTRWFTK